MMPSVAIRAWFILLGAVTLWSYWLAPQDEPTTTALQSAVYVLAPATAMVGGWLAVQQFGWKNIQGKAFIFLSLALTCWFVGESLWVLYERILEIDPYPSLADYFYLTAYLGFIIGLGLEIKFLHAGLITSTQKLLLAIIGILLVAAASYFGLYLAVKPDYSFLENAVAISYGLGDVALVLMGLGLLVIAMELRGGKFANAWGWFVVGLACTFIGDIGFAWFTPEYETAIGYYKPALDTIWIMSYLAMACGLGLFVTMIAAVQHALRNVKKS